jgi:hypothetical protein
MSGEFTTSEGNSLINYCMLSVWLDEMGVTDYRIHVNGDDSVVIMEFKDLNKVKYTLDFFKNFNMETTLDIIAYDFRQISYCQASPVRVLINDTYEWRMVKNPIRTMSRMSYCDYKYLIPINRYRAGIALCELACSAGVPVLQEWCMYNLRVARLASPLGSVDKVPANLFTKGDIKISKIGSLTREDFYVAFGMDIHMQQLWESSLAGIAEYHPNDITRYINKYKQFHKN